MKHDIPAYEQPSSWVHKTALVPQNGISVMTITFHIFNKCVSFDHYMTIICRHVNAQYVFEQSATKLQCAIFYLVAMSN